MRQRFLDLIGREIATARQAVRTASREDESHWKTRRSSGPVRGIAGRSAIDLIVRGSAACGRVSGLQRVDQDPIDHCRFLEHPASHFAAGKENPIDGEFFIGSGDWMFRHLSAPRRGAAAVTALTGPRAGCGKSSMCVGSGTSASPG